MAITPNTTFTAGAVLTADQMNRLPWGVMGKAEATANQASIGTGQTDVTNLSVTFTADSSRIYRTSVYAIVQQDTASGLVFVRLTDGSNNQKNQWMQTSVATGFYTCSMVTVESGLSGSTTRKVRANAQANTMSIQAAATYPAVIVVEDIGQA